MNVKLEIQSLDKICRTCLSNNDNLINLLTEIITVDNVIVKMTKILEICTSIQVQNVLSLNDVAYLICKNCKERLASAYTFRQQALKAEEAFRHTLAIDNYQIKEEKVEKIKEETDDLIFNENSDIYFLDPPESNEDIDVIPKLETAQWTDYTLFENSDAGDCLKGEEKEIKGEFETGIKQVLKRTRRKELSLRKMCRFCGFISATKRGFSLHISHAHREMRNKWCRQCFIEVDNLAEHKKTHPVERTFICTLCRKAFRCAAHLKDHVKTHSGERSFKCKICSRAFTTSGHLRVHTRLHTGEKPYECDACHARFTQNSHLIRHQQRVHKVSKKVYKCQVCKKIFPQLKKLTNHSLKTGHHLLKSDFINVRKEADHENSKNTFKIDENTDPVYIADEVIDYDTSTTLCLICNKAFSTNLKWRIHMRMHTGDTPYKCEICGKACTTNSHLISHDRTHTGEKPHVCHTCGKSFAQSSVLSTHMKIHTGKPEVCDICNQRFCRKAELRLHMRKHTGEKPYLCTECGQSFIQTSHLNEHLKTHSEERPYKCTFCHRGFKHKSTLRCHERIHTGEKPYKCKYCDYACRQKYSLTTHMTQHTDAANTNPCSICWKRFKSEQVLDAHVKKCHSE